MLLTKNSAVHYTTNVLAVLDSFACVIYRNLYFVTIVTYFSFVANIELVNTLITTPTQCTIFPLKYEF